MLKDYMPITEPTLVEFNVEEFNIECGIILDKICLANKILEQVQQDESISYETGIALLLPLYDYDKEFLKADLLTIESSYYDRAYHRTANKQSSGINFGEIIKKLFRIFYNLFQKLLEKIILWMHGIEPYIDNLISKIDKIDFSKKPEDFTEMENNKLLNYVGVFALFNGKLEDNVIGRIITSFKNMKDITTAIDGYKDFIGFFPSLFNEKLSMEDFNSEAITSSAENGLNSKFFSKLPKFYKDISGQLRSCIENGSVDINGVLKRHIVDGSIKGIEDICIFSTNGTDLNILYTTSLGTLTPITLKHTTGNINNEALLKNVTLSPLDKSKIDMLISSIQKNDIKSLSNNIRTSFKNLESEMNSVMKKMDSIKFEEGITSYYNQLSRAIFSDNLSILNTLCFNFITQNSKLTSNTLKLIELSLSKYEQKEEKPIDGQKLLK